MISTISHASCSLSGRQGITGLARCTRQGVLHGMLGIQAKALLSISHRWQLMLFRWYFICRPIL